MTAAAIPAADSYITEWLKARRSIDTGNGHHTGPDACALADFLSRTGRARPSKASRFTQALR
jgi:hypothetical protein